MIVFSQKGSKNNNMNNNMSINNLINDKQLIDRCNEFTQKSLNAGISINGICRCVKNYQQIYISLNDKDKKDFTFDVWYVYQKEKGTLFTE